MKRRHCPRGWRRTAELAVEPAPEPHPRHADILGWPEEPEGRLERALVLANASVLVPAPTE